MYGHNNPTLRYTEESEQVGPKMHSAIKLCDNGRVWPSKNQLAKRVGPNGSTDYGYRIVNRCIRKDLLKVDAEDDTATPNAQGAVKLTDKGERYLEREA